MSWKGDLLKAGISSDGVDVEIYRGDLTVYGNINFTGGATITGGVAFGSRTSGSGTDLGTYETGLLVAAQYEDLAALANTTDYVGCSAIFNLHMNRAITLAAGGGYGWAGIWSNVEIDANINQTGATSAAWLTLWMDGTSAIAGSSRLQGLDIALVSSGSGQSFGASTKLYGIRLDSSINASTTISGEFAAINIEAAGAKKDWTIGIDINGCTTGIDVGAGTNGIAITGAQGADGIVVSGQCTASPFHVTGSYTTGLWLAADGTTGLYITSAFAGGTDMILLEGTATTGLNITGNTTNGIAISGDCSGSGLTMTGTNGVDITLPFGATIDNSGTNTLVITEAIIDLTAATRIDLDGNVTLSGLLTFDTGGVEMTLVNGATISNVDDATNSGDTLTLTEDCVKLVGSGWGRIQFGGNISGGDWGAGTGGQLLDGLGYDWVTSTIGRVESGALGTACAAAYHAMTVDVTSHTSTSSFFGTWTELYFIADCILTGASNAAAVWGQVEGLGAFTTPDSGDFVAAGYFNLKSTGTVTLTGGSHFSGVISRGEVNAVSSTTEIFAAFECWASTTDWNYGLYLANCALDIRLHLGATLLNEAPGAYMAGGGLVMDETINAANAGWYYGIRSNPIFTADQGGAGEGVGGLSVYPTVTGDNVNIETFNVLEVGADAKNTGGGGNYLRMIYVVADLGAITWTESYGIDLYNAGSGSWTAGIRFSGPFDSALDFTSVTASTNTDGVLMKCGTSKTAAGIILATNGQTAMEFYISATPTSGRIQGLYLDLVGDGASGTCQLEAGRFNIYITASKVAGNCRAVRATVRSDGGTCAGHAQAGHFKVASLRGEDGTTTNSTFSGSACALGIFGQLSSSDTVAANRYNAIRFDCNSSAEGSNHKPWDAIFYVEAGGQNSVITHFLRTGDTYATLDGADAWFSTGTPDDALGSAAGSIRISLGGVDYYIPYFDSVT